MKLKKLLNENLWNERKFGEPLPTLADTTRAYKLKQEALNENQDVKKLASMLGFKEFAVKKFIDKYKDLEADDLIDVIEASRDRRRSSLMVMAAMNHNRKALRQLDDLLGFM